MRSAGRLRSVRVNFVKYGSMGVWEYGSMGVWEYGSMGVWEYGSMGVWEYTGTKLRLNFFAYII
jgi:hypothetical protein